MTEIKVLQPKADFQRLCRELTQCRKFAALSGMAYKKALSEQQRTEGFKFMCNDSALARLFGQFSGREISLSDARKIDPADPVLTEMQQVAEKHGYKLHLVWGDMGAVTTGYDPKRANIRVEQKFDGKWHVGNSFHTR